LLAQTLSSALADIAMVGRRVRLGGLERHLVIAVLPSVATCWLIPKLSDFRSRHPDVATRVIYAIHGQPIDFEEVDVAIVYHTTPPADLADVQKTKLLNGDSAPVCSGAFLELHGPLDTPEQMIAAGILHDTDMLGWRRWLSLAGAASTVPPSGPMFEDFNLLRAATLSGQGIALCPLSIIRDDIVQGRLVQLSPHTVLGESGYYLLQAKRSGQAPHEAQQKFCEWATQTAMEEMGS
jgi:DNA-binding transcriptional LysR family regulator